MLCGVPVVGSREEVDPLLQQHALQAGHLGARQVGERARVEVDRAQRRQQEVAADPQHPVDRLRRDVEQRRPQVGGEHEREPDRQRQEDDEGDIEGRQHVRHEAGAEQRVQQRGGVVAREQRAVGVGELGVEVVARAQQRDDRLQVAVGHVGRVEADQREARRRHPRGRPALAPDLRHRLARRPAAARARAGPPRDVEADEQRHAEPDQAEVERRDVVGVAQRQPDGVGRDDPPITVAAATSPPAHTPRQVPVGEPCGCALMTTPRRRPAAPRPGRRR